MKFLLLSLIFSVNLFAFPNTKLTITCKVTSQFEDYEPETEFIKLGKIPNSTLLRGLHSDQSLALVYDMAKPQLILIDINNISCTGASDCKIRTEVPFDNPLFMATFGSVKYSSVICNKH